MLCYRCHENFLNLIFTKECSKMAKGLIFESANPRYLHGIGKSSFNVGLHFCRHFQALRLSSQLAMPLFSCKFEATIGGDSGQQINQLNNQANNENRQPNNEANQHQPNNENRQPNNEANQRQPNNENRQPNKTVNPEPPNSGSHPPNNPENRDPQSKGNRQPKNPAKPDPENKGTRNPEYPALDNKNYQLNNQANPGLLNFGTGDPKLFSVVEQTVPKPLFVPRGDNGPIIGFTANSMLLRTIKRPGESMSKNPSKQQKLDNPFNGSQTSVPVPESVLVEDHVRVPDLSLKLQAPRNNSERFYNSNRDITIMPTTDAINEQIRCAGNYEVWNLSFRHKVYGEVVFLGSRDLGKLEPDLSKVVQFRHGKFELGPNIQHNPMLCILNNITREDLAKQVSKRGGPPTNDELYRILTALAIVVDAKCWSYSEQEKEWIFITSQRGTGKQGYQTKQESQKGSENYDEDDEDDDDDDE